MRMGITRTVFLTLMSRLTIVPERRGSEILQLCVLITLLFGGDNHRFTYFGVVPTRLNVVLVTIRLSRVGTLFVQHPTSIDRVTVNQISNVRVSAFTNDKIMSTCFCLITNRPYRQMTSIISFNGKDYSVSRKVLNCRALVRPVRYRRVTQKAPRDSFLGSRFITVGELTTCSAFQFINCNPVIRVRVITCNVNCVSHFEIVVSVNAFL